MSNPTSPVCANDATKILTPRESGSASRPSSPAADPAKSPERAATADPQPPASAPVNDNEQVDNPAVLSSAADEAHSTDLPANPANTNDDVDAAENEDIEMISDDDNSDNDNEEAAPPSDDEKTHTNKIRTPRKSKFSAADTPASTRQLRARRNQKPEPPKRGEEGYYSDTELRREMDLDRIINAAERRTGESQPTSSAAPARTFAFRPNKDRQLTFVETSSASQISTPRESEFAPGPVEDLMNGLPPHLREKMVIPERIPSLQELGLEDEDLNDPFRFGEDGNADNTADVARAVLACQSPEVFALITDFWKNKTQQVRETLDYYDLITVVSTKDTVRRKTLPAKTAKVLINTLKDRIPKHNAQTANQIKRQLLNASGDRPHLAIRVQVAFDHVHYAEWAKIKTLFTRCDMSLEKLWEMLLKAQWKRKTSKNKTTTGGHLRATDIRTVLGNFHEIDAVALPSDLQVAAKGFARDAEGLFYRPQQEQPVFTRGWSNEYFKRNQRGYSKSGLQGSQDFAAQRLLMPTDENASVETEEPNVSTGGSEPTTTTTPMTTTTGTTTKPATQPTSSQILTPRESGSQSPNPTNKNTTTATNDDDDDDDDNDDEEDEGEAPTGIAGNKRKIQEVTDWYDPEEDITLPRGCQCRSPEEVESCIGTIDKLWTDTEIHEVFRKLGEKGLFETLCQQHLLFLTINARLIPTISYSELMHRFRSISEARQNLAFFRRGRSAWFHDTGEPAEPNSPKKKRVKYTPLEFCDEKSVVPQVDREGWTMKQLRLMIMKKSFELSPAIWTSRPDHISFGRPFAYWNKEIETPAFGKAPLRHYVFLEAAFYRELLRRSYPNENQMKTKRHLIQCFYSIGQQLIRADPFLYWIYVAMNPKNFHVMWYPAAYYYDPDNDTGRRCVIFKNKKFDAMGAEPEGPPREWRHGSLTMPLRPVVFDEYGFSPKYKTKVGDFAEISGMMMFGRPPQGTQSKRYGFDQTVDFSWSPISKACLGASPFIDSHVREYLDTFLRSTPEAQGAMLNSWEDKALEVAQAAYLELFAQETKINGEDSVSTLLSRLLQEAKNKNIRVELPQLLAYHFRAGCFPEPEKLTATTFDNDTFLQPHQSGPVEDPNPEQSPSHPSITIEINNRPQQPPTLDEIMLSEEEDEGAEDNEEGEQHGEDPFFALYGFHPTTPGETLLPHFNDVRLNSSSHIASAERAARVLDFLQSHITWSQDRHAEAANAHRRPHPRYRIGDRVFIDTRHFRNDRTSKSLGFKRIGPCAITRIVDHKAYEVDIPPSLASAGVTNVFHPDKLSLAPTSTFPGQRQATPPPVMIYDNDGVHPEWEIDEIVDCRRTAAYGVQYRAKFIGDWPEWNARPPWQPWTDFVNAPQKILDFHARHPRAPPPPSHFT
ncbi:retrotransposon nucleocapsid protein [Ascosphaera apis ARSEF 7405]|uniref:Retrotransposon nucleocapsid protein n=1 Tax=Ascosphaera apis ARSEF 7405 TaxID=392613 RepID=A0A162ICR2_9EURO|nr:retrotransposon nucleocapsid protein [Ascosphaera apis ARSEF 7405]